MKNSILLILSLIVSIVECEYRHKIEPFSFDVQKFEYPLEFDKVGTTVALRDTIKLIPKVEDRYGGLYMSQPIETDAFEMTYSIDLKNDRNTIYTKTEKGIDIDDIEGFVLWYLNDKPSYKDYGTGFGFRSDYNGLGVYVFKHLKKWRVIGIYNQGLAGMSVESVVANLTKPDNSCIMYDYDGGQIDFNYKVQNKKLSLEYSTSGATGKYTSCIQDKAYMAFYQKGYVGISAGNPHLQNVNEIDVHRIDFFNMNPEYYQHDAADIVDEQHYYKRDENGFVGKTAYPFSAKLSTIELGKVAYDILEMKRNQREHQKEQFKKTLNIIKPDDDVSEVLFKMFEQMRLVNDDLVNHLKIQQTKKAAVEQFEKVLLKDSDYAFFIGQVRKEDATLYEISQKFTDLTAEAKRILDEIKKKSDQRKADFGVTDGEEKPVAHHKPFPPHIEDALQDTTQDIGMLTNSFTKFTNETNQAVISLRDSQNRVLAQRKESSIYGNQNVFSELKRTKDDRAKEVFGPRGRGIYQDSVLKQINERVQQRTIQLEKVIEERQSNEQFVSGMLICTAILSICIVWQKFKQSMSGKMMMGGFGQNPGQTQMQSNYI